MYCFLCEFEINTILTMNDTMQYWTIYVKKTCKWHNKMYNSSQIDMNCSFKFDFARNSRFGPHCGSCVCLSWNLMLCKNTCYSWIVSKREISLFMLLLRDKKVVQIWYLLMVNVAHGLIVMAFADCCAIALTYESEHTCYLLIINLLLDGANSIWHVHLL